jgi:DNA-binding transcriptional LysR family regulator
MMILQICRTHGGNSVLKSPAMIDWNDIRYLVAVADLGSTLAASRLLRVSQTTVARRLHALEDAAGISLFDRNQGGYRLTPEGEALLGEARAMTAAGENFEQAVASRARSLSGTVRLTTEDIFAHTLLGPILVDLRAAHPDIVVELDITSDIRDLGAGEADIAIRSTKKDPPAGVVGRRICRDDWTLYCSRTYADKHGVPDTKEDLRNHAIVAGGGGSLWRAYQAYLKSLDLEDRVAIHQPTSGGLLSSVRAGLGIGVLPCLIAEGDPDLIQCLPPRRNESHDLWLMTHERVRHSPPVRAAIDFIYARLMQQVNRLGLAKAA